MDKRIRLSIALTLSLMACALRLYHVGDWPYADDETATLAEESAYFSSVAHSLDSQIGRLPHAIPVSYFVLHASTEIFGRDERGSRVLFAITGALSVPIVFLLLRSSTGWPTALATALLVTFWPEHILRSQQTRFYIVAWFFACVAVLVGAIAVKRRSAWFAALASTILFVAVLTHTLTGILAVVLGVSAFATFALDRRAGTRLLIGTLVPWCLFLPVLVAYFLPFLRSWNESAIWGYSVVHSILASINMLGWPVALLAMIGGLMILKQRDLVSVYWAVAALTWLIATVVLPLVLPYHPGYVFPLALGPMVLAGTLIGSVYQALRVRWPLAAMAWLVLVPLVSLPSLASHYLDGTRFDFRTAAGFVDAHWQPGDRVVGASIGLIHHYAPRCEPAIPLSMNAPVVQLAALTSDHRLWIVVPSTRTGIPEDLRSWLDRHSTHVSRVGRPRLDYYEHTIDVFLVNPAHPR